MWRKPGYNGGAETERQPRKAPVPSGRHVAAIDRPGFRSGPNQQLRVAVDAVEQGPLFVSLRVWEQASDGGWFPTRTGITVRAREGEAVIEAISQALLLVDDPLIEAQVHRHNAAVKGGHPGEPVDYTPTNPASTPPRSVRARVTSSTPAPARAPTRRAALTHQGHQQSSEQRPRHWDGRDVNTQPDWKLSTDPNFDEG